jgi:hypothetical protein
MAGQCCSGQPPARDPGHHPQMGMSGHSPRTSRETRSGAAAATVIGRRDREAVAALSPVEGFI